MSSRSPCLTLAFAILALSSFDRADAQNLAQAPIWGVTCAGTSAGLDCRAVQSLPMTNTGQATVAVHVASDTKKPTMFVLVPLGIYLPAGLTVQFGQDAARKVALHNCDSTGCLAEIELAEAEIAAMSKGQALTVSVQDTSKQPITVQVPNTGFAAAYAKIK